MQLAALMPTRKTIHLNCRMWQKFFAEECGEHHAVRSIAFSIRSTSRTSPIGISRISNTTQQTTMLFGYVRQPLRKLRELFQAISF
jgi:hypothetical protein